MSLGNRGSLSSSISAPNLSGTGQSSVQTQRLPSSAAPSRQHGAAWSGSSSCGNSGGSSGSLLRASRPGSAAAARAAVQDTSVSERSAGLTSDPKMKVLQAFAGKFAGKFEEEEMFSPGEVDAGSESLGGSSEPELEAEEVRPALLETTAASLPTHLASGGSQHGSFNADMPNNSTCVTFPVSQNARRPNSASSALGRERRQRPGLAQRQRQRTSGCDKFDHKVREIAKEAKAEQARRAKSKHARPAQSEQSRVAELNEALGDTSKFNRTTRLVWSASSMPNAASLPRPKSAGACAQAPSNCLPLDGHRVRQHFHQQSEQMLRRLLVDVDLAVDSGLPKDSHKARCATVDRVFEWYERHASAAKAPSREPKNSDQPGIGPAWLFVRADEPPPPGSLRSNFRQPSPLLSLQPSSYQAESLGRSMSTPSLGLVN